MPVAPALAIGTTAPWWTNAVSGYRGPLNDAGSDQNAA